MFAYRVIQSSDKINPQERTYNMTNNLTRRGFIYGSIALSGIASGCLSAGFPRKRWYKGNLHAHTYWSDGQAFPDEAVEWYKSHGYNFLGLSDHNIFQDAPDKWVNVAEPEDNTRGVKKQNAERYLKNFPAAQTRIGENGTRQIRLKTFDELSKAFNEPGEFIMIPDVEATRSSEFDDGRLNQLHMNYVNLPQLLPSYRAKDFSARQKNKDISAFLGETAAEVAELAEKLDKPHLFILNHPIWTWYDIGPEALIDNPSVRFFELCNNGSPFAPGEGLPADGFDTDRLWDVVNAFRARRGQGLLYGVGTDDTHYYNGEHGKMLMPGNAWSLVRANSLTCDEIVNAMLDGDFVTCEMLEPEDVNFDHISGRLDVSVAAKPAVSRTIKFIVAKKDFSEQPVKTVTVVPAEKKDSRRFERTINIYDDKIGMTAKLVKGEVGKALSASYTLQNDDLYVRARIEESGQPLCTAYLHPQGKHVCWTQPYQR